MAPRLDGDTRGERRLRLLVHGARLVAPLAGAALLTLAEYRLLLGIEAAVVAGAGVWLLTRAARGVAASH